MNSLSYLSRQFDAVIASSSSSSSPTSKPAFSTPSSPVSSSSSVRYLRNTSSKLKRVKSSSSIHPPQSPTPSQAPGTPTPSSPLNTSMNSGIRAKSPPDLLSRLVFVRLFLLLWSLLRAAWNSLPIRKQHVEEPESEVEAEVVQVEGVVHLNTEDEDAGAAQKPGTSQHPHRQQLYPPLPPYSLTVSAQSSTSPLSLQSRIRTLTPTPPPIPQPRGPTPFHLPKTLVLDLDETLIHSTSRPLHHNSHSSSNLLGLKAFRRNSLGASHTVEVVLGGRSTTYHVYKRPFVDYFLRKVSTWYTLVIFTASMQEYADPVIDWLDAGRGILGKRLFRESCTQLPNGAYTKDLTIVESDLARVCLVDNSPISYNINEANGIPIEGWTHDPHDEALLELLPVLDSLRFTGDVRRVLGIRGFS